MAGIGFELKKMFDKKGIMSIVKAYGYAGIVCTGPMLLGVALLLGIRLLAGWAGASEHDMELLNSMVTYTLLVSLVLTNALSLVTTRYTADMIYTKRRSFVMPSFWGSVNLILVIGSIAYGIFLHFSGVCLLYQVLCLVLFGELVLAWTEINYLTAVKDYRKIVLVFTVAVAAGLLTGWLLTYTGLDLIGCMLFSVCISYAIMSVWYYGILAKYFPQGHASSMNFLKWLSRFPQLSLIGIFLALGLFGHLVIMWTSPLQVQIQGLFYGAPMYDVSALLAFFSILVTTISFVTSVEVNFYPKYRTYFSLFNDGGSYMDILQAEKEMKATLIRELKYTFTKQFFSTVVFILVGSLVFPMLPLGMNEEMLGIYRVLCIGYAFYAAGNCTMLLQLYFADNRGAMYSTLCFMLTSCIGTWLLKNGDVKYLGVGFLLGGIIFTAVSLLLLRRYMKKMIYHVLCSQPMLSPEPHGFLCRVAERCDTRYNAKRTVKEGKGSVAP